MSTGEEVNSKKLSAPTVSIYQHPDHVAGILQQVFGQPLITDESLEGTDQTTRSTGFQGTSDATVEGKGSVPFLGEIGAKIGLRASIDATRNLVAGNRLTRNYLYSQAYYLAVVKEALEKSNLIRRIASKDDSVSLKPGTIVEFEAAFEPNQISAVLDILTPDLIAEITRYSKKRKAVETFQGWDSFEQVQAHALEVETVANAQGDVARAIAEAVKSDFRTTHTREFYGSIGLGDELVTAITICDNAHFVVEDEDRILDGRFTVLGKVISEPEEDIPVLARNKLLRRIGSTAVDQAFDWLKERASELSERFPGTPEDSDDDLGAEDAVMVQNLVDMDLDSRVYGTSFKIIPIAIYA